MKTIRFRHLFWVATAIAAFALEPVHASTYYYANWTSDTLSTGSAAGSASGNLITPQGTVSLSYTGDVTSSTQVGAGGTDYYIPTAVYTNATVSNLPTNNNLIALAESPAYTDVLTFSSPLVNPILDIVSLGQPGAVVTYNFDATPVILSQGAGYFGGCSTCLTVSGNSLAGREGSGVIEFVGTFSSISWTTTGGEYWNGFTVGVAGESTGTTPEPSTWMELLIGSVLVLALPMGRKFLAKV